MTALSGDEHEFSAWGPVCKCRPAATLVREPRGFPNLCGAEWRSVPRGCAMTDGLRYAPSHGAEPHSASYFTTDDAHAGGGQESPEPRLSEVRHKRIKRRILTLSLIFADGVAGFSALLTIEIVRDSSIDFRELVTVLACFPVYFLAALQTGAHSPAVATRVRDSIRAASGALAITTAIFLFALLFPQLGAAASRPHVAATLLLCFVFGSANRFVLGRIAEKHLGTGTYSTLCIYADVPLSRTSGSGAVRASDVDLVPDLGRPEMVARLGQLAEGMDIVVVHCPVEQRPAWARLLKCIEVRSEIVVPEMSDLRPLELCRRGGQASLVLAKGPLTSHQRILKRLFDLSVVILAVPLLVPVMVVVALAIQLDSPGPVFFSQRRIGIGNRSFYVLKFRTMHAAMEDAEASKLTSRDDPRVTRVGAFLRSTSLDELPQVVNVLMGQMSLVGPRPHALKALAGDALYWEVDTSYWLRHSVKPGITGLAQIRGHRGNTFAREHLLNRLQADLEYVNSWSLLGDLKILVTTFAVLRKNAF